MRLAALLTIVGCVAALDGAAILVARKWVWLSNAGNAAGVQAVSAAVIMALTAVIVAFTLAQVHVTRRQADIGARQTEITEEQARIQKLLAWLEHAPIMCAEFGPAYDAAANRITLKNGGRGAAHNIRGHLWVVTGFSSSQTDMVECIAEPTYLGPGDAGSASVELEDVAALRDIESGLPPRQLDRWVLHYGDVLGEKWHTTSNIDDKGRHTPLGYFRSWSPHDWAALPESTRKLCQVCLADAHLQAVE